MRISDVKEFGKIIKARRKELGYTQGYVSEVTGFSVSFISELENGKSTAEIGRALALANILGLDVEVNARR
jgi:transcriptional regulator with XRE-family HTH domain